MLNGCVNTVNKIFFGKGTKLNVETSKSEHLQTYMLLGSLIQIIIVNDNYTVNINERAKL